MTDQDNKINNLKFDSITKSFIDIINQLVHRVGCKSSLKDQPSKPIEYYMKKAKSFCSYAESQIPYFCEFYYKGAILQNMVNNAKSLFITIENKDKYEPLLFAAALLSSFTLFINSL